MEEERINILKMVEAGRINAEEALTLLAALEITEPEVSHEFRDPTATRPERPGDSWARFWIYPLMAGGIMLMVGALIMGLVYAIGAAPGWQLCGWFPMILGLIVMLLAWWSQRARWLHLRISQPGRRTMALSFPVRLTLAAWALRIGQPFVPQLKDTGIDDLIIALRDSAMRDEPLSIDVQQGEDGERVQLYIG